MLDSHPGSGFMIEGNRETIWSGRLDPSAEERSREHMKIGEAAKATGLTVSNIRFYEKKGLLCPKRREESQYREYGPEDVRRLKEILLLRKAGLSVERIYLLYQGQAELSGLIRRQEEELAEQMEMLAGSIRLCRRLEQEGALEELDVDRWLSCVQEEEEQGEKFAEVEELLEDLAEFSGLASFRGDPLMGRFFRNRWTARMLAFLIFLSLLAVAVSSVVSGGGILGPAAVVIFWILYLAGFGMDFFWFRKKRDRKRKEENE